MNGKLASLWMLVGGALMASALVLGGCVADAGDDEQVDESRAALSDNPTPPGLDGVVDTDQGVILEAPTPDDSGDPVGDPTDGCEPEPNPWEPGATPTPSGATPSNPQQGTQGQMKH
jgi:hypothetical protein